MPYTIFRQGENYPIWVREQGVGRNKSSVLTQVMDLYDRAGGDYHTSYWPQVHNCCLTLHKTENYCPIQKIFIPNVNVKLIR